MELQKRFIEAAQKKHPQDSEEKIQNQVLSSLFGVREIERLLATEMGHPKARKFSKIGSAILVSELNETAENYPHLTAVQVLRFFKNEALADGNVLLDSTGITRPMLIELVEALENYTGLRITDDSEAPLRYLDERSRTLTINDIAEYFSYSPSRIMSIQARDLCCVPSMSEKTKACQRTVVKSYLTDCCNGKEIDESLPIIQLRSDVTDNPYVIVHWLEGRFCRILNNQFVEQKTVGELLDFFAN